MTQELRKLAEAATQTTSMRVNAAYCKAAGPEEILSLLDRLEKAEKDAERYRFWRDKYPETFKTTDITPEDVDRLTDAAMEASK